MEQKQRIVRRYSTAFKQKVVSELERGTLSISEVRRRYEITGGSTLESWRRKYGTSYTKSQIMRIEMNDERDKLKTLEKEKRALESALAQAHLKIIVLESTLKVLEEERGSAIKKNTEAALSPAVSTIPSFDTEDTP